MNSNDNIKICTIAVVLFYDKQSVFLVTWCTVVKGFSKHASMSMSYSANWDTKKIQNLKLYGHPGVISVTISYYTV